MISGAIIGLIVGVAVVLATAVKQKRGARAIVAALVHGPEAARRELDAYVKPPVPGKKTELARLGELQERFAWLGILGAHSDLVQEAELVSGALTVVAQVRVQAATSLLAHRREASDLALLHRTNELIQTEGGAFLKLVKDYIQDAATLAGALEGKPFDVNAARRVYERADKGAPAVKIAQLRFLARMAEAAGATSTNFQQKADEAYAKLTAR